MKNIFIIKEQKKNNINDRKILSKNEIMSSIPNDALSEENLNLASSKTEIRWRIFKFPNIDNNIIEISQKTPNGTRLFMSQNSEWVEHNDDNIYNQYIIEKYYHYID
jgi:hypothetical protein